MTATPCDSCRGHCCTRYSVEVTVLDIEPSVVDGRPVNIVLGQVDGACRFFRPGAAGCGIYPVRPRSCAIYPFADGGRGRAVQRRYLLCPSDWNVGCTHPMSEASWLSWPRRSGSTASWSAAWAPPTRATPCPTTWTASWRRCPGRPAT